MIFIWISKAGCGSSHAGIAKRNLKPLEEGDRGGKGGKSVWLAGGLISVRVTKVGGNSEEAKTRLIEIPFQPRSPALPPSLPILFACESGTKSSFHCIVSSLDSLLRESIPPSRRKEGRKELIRPDIEKIKKLLLSFSSQN